MPTSDTPPRDIAGLRKWRVQQYEKQKEQELQKSTKPSPPHRVAPFKPLKKKAKEPGRFPRLGERAKRRGPGNLEAGEGFVD